MQMTIFTADCVGNAANCSYPNKAEVKCPKEGHGDCRGKGSCMRYIHQQLP